MSASLTIQTIRVQPTTDAFRAAEAEATIAAINATVEVQAAESADTATVTETPTSATTTVKTQELSGVWCPLLMTLANNTFCMSVNNEKKPFAFNGNSRILYKPQIQYSTPNMNSNRRNNCYTNDSQLRNHYHQRHYYIPNYCSRCCCGHCRHYRQITSGRLSDTINPQITKTIKDTTNNNLKVYCEMDTIKGPMMITTTTTNNVKEKFFSYNLQNPLPFIIFKSYPNSLVLLIVSHESLYPVHLQEKAIRKIDLENYNNGRASSSSGHDGGGSGTIQLNGYNLNAITRENLNKCLIKASENTKIKDKISVVQYVNSDNDDAGVGISGGRSIVKIVKNLDKFTVLLLKRK